MLAPWVRALSTTEEFALYASDAAYWEGTTLRVPGKLPKTYDGMCRALSLAKVRSILLVGDSRTRGLAVRLTEKLVLEKTKCSSLYGVRNVNLWGCSLTDVDVGAGPSATWLRNLPRDEWIGTASGAGPRASAVLINGERARGVATPPPRRARAGERLTLPPLSYAFVRASGVDAPACRE